MSKKQLVSIDTFFCQIQGSDQCLCTVHEGVSLWHVAGKLQGLLLHIQGSLQEVQKSYHKNDQNNVPVISYSHLRLIMTALDQAQGFADAISNTIDDMEANHE